MIKKVCAYGRVSTKSKSQFESLEHQEQYFREKLTKENGYELTQIYIDKGLTGTDFKNRDQFNQMLDDAGIKITQTKSTPGEIRNKYIRYTYQATPRTPKFKYIYVKNSSRFARNIEVISILRELRKNDVFVFFEDINKSTENESDEMIINLLLMMDERESKDKSEKVKFGASITAKNGKVRIGREMYGYNYNKEDNTLTKIEEESKVVQLIFNLRAEGYGSRVICNKLEEQGIKTRRGVSFRPNVVTRMLQNPVYMGKVVRNKYHCKHMFGENSTVLKDKNEWIIQDTDKVDKIIEEELFNEVQKLMDKSRECVGAKKGKYRARGEFAEKIVCEKCSAYYTKNANKLADGSKKVFYNCSTKKTKGLSACDSRNVQEEEIESLISYFLKEGNYKKTMLNFIKMTKEKLNEKKATLYIDVNQEEINKLKSKIEIEKNKLSKIMDMFLEDTSENAKEVFNLKKEQIDNNIKILEVELNKLTKTDVEKESQLEEIKKCMDVLEKMYNETPSKITREYFIENILYAIVVKENRLQIITKAHMLILAIKEIDKTYK